MTTLREAAQQALEFIKVTNASSSFWFVPESNLNKTVKALRAALEQPEQEPVAWRSQNATPPGGFVIFQQYPQALADLGRKIEPLYTHPPRRTGLPHCECSCEANAFQIEIRRLKAALKEKNHE